jgi:DNA-binding beta-propeller fold protein YncE
LTRRQKRKIAIIIILLVILALLAAYYAYYRTTQRLSFDISPVTGEVVSPPEYLYSFSGGEEQRLQRPVGVLVDDRTVYVVDSARSIIDVFDEDGERLRSFGASETIVPLYIAKNPLDDTLYVTDRRARTIHIYEPSGEYLGEFDPQLPESELPTFETQGYQWAPVAVEFGDDGTLYVTEILKGHRLMIFSPDGEFVRSVGTAGVVTVADEAPMVFQFPNGLVYHEDKLYVADSNNRRVQVFDKDGTFDRIVVTQGLPRGIDFLQPFPSDEADTGGRYIVVDTLAHDATIWSTKDEKLVNFGQQGILEGNFSYPTSVSIMERNNKIFITDTANGRVQVWGWPSELTPIPLPDVSNWPWCLAPLLLLPLLLLLRKKRFFATSDFIDGMIAFEDAEAMPHRRRRWFVAEEVYAHFEHESQGDVEFGALLHEVEFSESDTRALMERFEIEYDTARTLAMAQRAHVFTTEDEELRRLARALELDVVNRVEYLERFASKDRKPPEQA